jgi:hypothetical protein
MNGPVAILIAGALIAAAILVTNNWELTVSYNGTGAGHFR